MSHITLNKHPLHALLAAAHNMQNQMNNGSIPAAFGDGTPDQVNDTISAFDNLAACAKRVELADKQISPFLRYRREILGNYTTAAHLQALVLNLWGGYPSNLLMLFQVADEHHTRIALELITSYTNYGENDSQFMSLGMELFEAKQAAEEAAAEQTEEVAA